MSTVTCPNCKTKNTEGSKFCNRCGVALPPSTHVVCPNCQTRNPRNLLYCDNCGTRLGHTGELSFEETEEETEPDPEVRSPRAFSLPAREPGEELDPDNLLDWLRTGEEGPEGEEGGVESPSASSAEQEAVLDDWLSELSEVGPAETTPDEGEEAAEEELPDWLSDVETEPAGAEPGETAEEELPDWLSEFGLESEEAVGEESAEEELPDWLSEFGLESDETIGEESAEEELPDWLSDSEGEEEETPSVIESVGEMADESELTDWASRFDTETDETGLDETAEEDALPDWLSEFDVGEGETAASIESVEETAEEGEFADWLSRFDDEEEETAEEEDLPDWLGDFDIEEEEGPAPVEAVEEPEAESEFADWLGELDADEEAAGAAETAEEEDLPDWLGDFDVEEEAPAPVEAVEEPEAESEFADWLGELDADEEAAGAAETAGEEMTEGELPDWLGDFDDIEEEEGPAPVEAAEELEAESEFADWLSDLDADEEVAGAAETAAEGDLPDWLGDFDIEEEEPPVPVEAEEEIVADSEFADWLSELEEGEETTSEEIEEVEDWLEDFEEMEAAEPGFETVAVEEGAADEEIEMPDWLADMPTYDTKIQPFDEEEETADLLGDLDSGDLTPVDELPDWLSDVAPVEEVEPIQEETTEPSGDEMPDWLEDFPADVESLEEDEDIDWLGALTEDEAWPDMPDEEAFIAQLDESEEEEPVSPTAPSQELKGVPKELVSSDLPDWLQDDMPEAELLEEDEQVVAEEEGELVQADIPEWLQQMKPADQEESLQDVDLEEDSPLVETRDEWQAILDNMPASEPDLVPGAENLSAAEIPAWLQALKPGDFGQEEIEPPEIDEPPETEGPLAGIPGVLPVAPVMTKPVAATSPIQYTISKEQQQQISLLHQLTHEDQPKTKQVSQRKETAFSTPWRTLLGLLLLLVVLAGLLLPEANVELPEMALPVPENALDTFNTVDEVSGRSVLVAFEYTPAMAGELDPIALMLLRQLAQNGNRVVTISQSAAGMAVAERLMDEVNDGIDSRALPLLTGEAVGLRSLGSCLNSAENCEPLYDTDNTELVNDLSDVGLVIILTNDRNSLVNWVEQVESQNEMPVIAAVTQSLGPLTIPYLSSGQLEGSLNGIPAASAYEKRLLGQNGSAFTQFTAQSIVMWVVIATLIVAALYYGLTGMVRGRQR